METADTSAKNISKGVYVRYTGTGTAGEVLETKTDDEGFWSKMDTTGLWYNNRFLEVLDDAQYDKLRNREHERKSRGEVEAAELAKRKVDTLKKSLEDVDMSTELCDGGG